MAGAVATALVNLKESESQNERGPQSHQIVLCELGRPPRTTHQGPRTKNGPRTGNGPRTEN
jgi:hypothetical protein